MALTNAQKFMYREMPKRIATEAPLDGVSAGLYWASTGTGLLSVPKTLEELGIPIGGDGHPILMPGALSFEDWVATAEAGEAVLPPDVASGMLYYAIGTSYYSPNAKWIIDTDVVFFITDTSNQLLPVLLRGIHFYLGG